MRTARLAVCCALACVLTVPAAARAAPAVEPLKPCYVSAGPAQREAVQVAASGFTPNALVDVTIDGQPVPDGTGVQADPSGSFEGSVLAPYRRRGEAPFTVTLTEAGNPANTVSTESRVTALVVDVTPRQAAPTRRVRFAGRGFTDPSLPVFAHYVFSGRHRQTVRMGRPRGACGTFDTRRRQIPVQPRTGTWLVQFDQLEDFTDPPQAIYVQLQIRVFRSFPDPG